MAMQSNCEGRRSRSYLFMLRIWLEDLGDGASEWRGQILCTGSGEVRYFREWDNLASLVRASLPQTDLGPEYTPVAPEGKTG